MENADAGKCDLDLLQSLRRHDDEALRLLSDRYGISQKGGLIWVINNFVVQQML